MPTATPACGDPIAAGTDLFYPDAAAPDLRYLDDPQAFARAYFPEYCRLAPSELHAYLFDRRRKKTADPLDAREGQLDVVLAPRGAAKTTLVSLLFPLHALAYALEPYIVIITATQQLAQRRIANLRSALERYPHWNLGNSSPASARPSPKIKANARALEFNGCRVEAHSTLTEIRGLLHGAHRPTWIILDDAELGERVHSERHRNRNHAWFAEVVENLGAANTNIDIIGTLLHADALPARLMNRPQTVSRLFKSIIEETASPELWAQWRRIYHDLGDPDRAANARAFYELNKAAMDRGAKVLWPEKEDYYALNVKRETIGCSAFEKEKQNAPEFGAAGVFRTEKIGWFNRDGDKLVPEGDTIPPANAVNLRYFGYLDPAMGNTDGDFAAVSVVGLAGDGRIFAVDSWLAKVPPSEQIARIFDFHAQYGFEKFGVETNAFQRMYLEPLEAERERRRAAGRPFDINFEHNRSHKRKNDRILTLEPLIDNRRLLLDRALDRQFSNQLEEFPQARYDDGPDALAGAVDLAANAILIPLRPLRRIPRNSPDL